MIEMIRFYSFLRERDVRVVVRNGIKWFVLKDIANILGIKKNGRDRFGSLPKKEKGKLIIYCKNYKNQIQRRKLNIVNVSGLFRVIMSSIKPISRQLQDWVYKEILSDKHL